MSRFSDVALLTHVIAEQEEGGSYCVLLSERATRNSVYVIATRQY